ncbi:MAG: hypothetical protein K0R67_270 [Paenibacillus sp.]|jgi:hypothetical protein|nr:hypothetical protein [Paenibacillus sp.]
MSKSDTLTLGQEQLREAWSRSLPTVMNSSDLVEVLPGPTEQSLRIHIASVGRTKYSLDFSVTYMDSREVRVELVDVEKDDRSVDEHSEMVQRVIQQYVRQLHECAQALHNVTHK